MDKLQAALMMLMTVVWISAVLLVFYWMAT